MLLPKRSIVALALLALAGPLVAAEETKAPPAVLAADRFDQFHKALLPGGGELQWALVPWRTSITLARHQAAVADKPLLIFVDTGAGFADALGLC